MAEQKDLVLSLDCGTQSIRGFLFDAEGVLLLKESVEVGEYTAEKPGQAEIDPRRFRDAIAEVCRMIREDRPDLFRRIAGITASCMRECMILVDEQGEAIRPCIVWLDRRTTAVVRPKNPILRNALRLFGVYSMATKSAMVSYTNWLQDNEPENWKKAYKFAYLSSYLNRWLCGRFVDTASAQAGHVAFNSKKFDWAGPLDIKYYLFPLDREKAVDIVDPGTVIGTLTEAAATALGLDPETKVIACASDKACETLGCGCADDRAAVLSFGSQTTIQTTIHRYYEVEPLVPAFAAAVPHCWNAEQQIYRGFWMVRWFIHNLGLQTVKEDDESETIMEDYIRTTPPGADGLIIYPYWGACVKRPDSTGAMVGFKDYHTRAHIYRAMLEGIGYTLKEAMLVMEKKKGSPMEYLVASGGGSQSAVVCQMMASIMDRPIVRMHTYEATGLGAAMTGYVALGRYGSFEDAAAAMTQIAERYEPQPVDALQYRTLYKKYMKKKKATY
jgi:sugar (pentulose or hexulose) kinase